VVQKGLSCGKSKLWNLPRVGVKLMVVVQFEFKYGIK
jgi:hypothetical protein